MLDPNEWSFGAELEFADIPQVRSPIPEIWRFDKRDVTMVNSNGVAVDPKGKFYEYGGEVNMLPTNSPGQLIENFAKIIYHYPEARVNHRTGLHIHVRVPGLWEDLTKLKRIQAAIHSELRQIMHEIEPLPELIGSSKEEQECRKMRKKSHQTFLRGPRLENQLKAETLKEFYEREVPQDKKGNPMWHAQSRLCANLRQLRETDTVEFRHFSGTLNIKEFQGAVNWCKLFMSAAINNFSIIETWENFKDMLVLPPPLPYNHRLELGYLLTCDKVPSELRKENIHKILRGELP